MLGNIARWGLRVIFMGTGILGLISLVSTPLSSYAIWGLTWGQVFIGAFVLSGLGVFSELLVENNRLRKTKPSIGAIKEVEENDCYCLEVKNTGSVGEFTAQIEVLADTTGRHKGKLYIGYWVFDTRHYKSEIKTNHVDRLKIVHLGDKEGVKEVYLDYYDTQSSQPSSLLFSWANKSTRQDLKDIDTLFGLIKTPPQYTLKVVISSTPNLNEGSITKEYKLDAQELYDRKSSKIPKLIKFLNYLAYQRRNINFPMRQDDNK